jgi:hypothetical protein
MRACVGEEGGVGSPTPLNDGATSTHGDDVEDNIEHTGETPVQGREFLTFHVNTIHTRCDVHIRLQLLPWYHRHTSIHHHIYPHNEL